MKSKGKLYIVHALAMPNENLLGDLRSLIDDKELEQTLDSSYAERKAKVHELANKYCPGGLEFEIRIEKESPDVLILAAADDWKADVVVMGTIARTGISGFFIGNTAERVINGLKSSILTVKPETFQTPVT